MEEVAVSTALVLRVDRSHLEALLNWNVALLQEYLIQ